MINVNISPMGRSLMSAYIGAIAYQGKIQHRNLEMLTKHQNNLQQAKKDAEVWEEVSFDITTGMIDKRFRESKTFIASGGTAGELRFKRSLSEAERQLEATTRYNMLKARTRYENTISTYNKKMLDRKLRSSAKKIDLRKFF